MSLLEVKNLNVSFGNNKALKHGLHKNSQAPRIHAVRDLGFSLEAGECLAIVGESGCGKSATLSSLLALEKTHSHVGGNIIYKNQDLHTFDEQAMRAIRGKEIAMIFQDPMSALNPTMSVGEQIAEALPETQFPTQALRKKRVIELIEEVQIADAGLRQKQYPFEFSGGMLQRIAIAIALAGEPSIILADEPTTALDVSIQKQILTLLKNLQEKKGMALLLVSHDLAVVAEMADKVLVMYAGSRVEYAKARDLFSQTKHPYTQALLDSLPDFQLNARQHNLASIPGQAPDLSEALDYCAFARRCPKAMNICVREKPPLYVHNDHHLACWLTQTGLKKTGV